MLVLEINEWTDILLWVLGGLFLSLFLLELFVKEEIKTVLTDEDDKRT